jgi:hypothetical protein
VLLLGELQIRQPGTYQYRGTTDQLADGKRNFWRAP